MATKKLVSSYTTTDGVKVKKYSDGSKTYDGKSSSSGSSSSSSSGSSKTTTTSKGQETADQTVERAKAMLGDDVASGGAYNPNTAAPTAARLDEIASQDFVTPENKAAYETTKLNPVNQNYMAASYNLPKTSVPDTAAAVQSPYQQFITPTVTPGFGDISSSTAGLSGLSSLNAANQAFYQKQLDRQEAQAAEQKSTFQTLLEGLTSPGEARDAAQKETGIDVEKYFAQQEASLKEVETLTKEYNATVQAKDEQIAATNDKMASMNFINNQTAQIERNAAPKLNRLSADINAKAAIMQAEQGNFAEAQKYVNQAVIDATAENKYKYDMFSMAYELNQDAFDRVETIYSDAYTAQMKIAEASYLEQKAVKEQIGKLLLDYPNAGIDIYNDNLQTAMDKAGVRAGVLETLALNKPSGDSSTADMKNYNAAVATGYTGSFADFLGKGTNSGTVGNYSDVMQQVIDAGGTPAQAAREAATASELQGVPVDQKTLSDWVNYANGLSVTPNVVTTPEQDIIQKGKTQGISNATGTEKSKPKIDSVTLSSIWNNLFGD